jgi:hypothetical protein
MYDVGSVARLFGVKYPDPKYDPNFDVNDDGKLDMFDVGTIARAYFVQSFQSSVFPNGTRGRTGSNLCSSCLIFSQIAHELPN